jgi:hypothetical protein
MREAFALDALILMSVGDDERAPGAAVTEALCGSVDHDPPCPLAPHQTNWRRDGEQVRLRVVFVAERGALAEVRRRIDRALSAGSAESPDGVRARWQLEEITEGAPSPEELELGSRLDRN